MKFHVRRLRLLAVLVAGAAFVAAGAAAARAAETRSLVVPDTQMAIVQTGNGGPEVLQYQRIPVLAPRAGEVLVKVVAAAINPIEWRNRTGGPRPQGGAVTATVPGGDLAGIVVRVGEGVTNLKVGDAVFAKLGPGQPGLNGAYAQYAVAPANQVMPKPSRQTFAEACGLATVGMTAMRALDHAQLASGERVFINGIGGGIGSSAAQIARARGAQVLGTASSRHHEYLRSIGASEVIDYQKEQFDKVIKQPVDVVIETVSTETANQALNILKPGGRLVSIAGAASAELCAAKGVQCARIGGAVGRSNAELMAEISRLAEAGLYKLNVDATFPLEQAGAAQDLNHSVGTTGKVVLIVDPVLAGER